MTEAKNVVQAIAAIMDELPAIGKDGKNKDQGYSFRGIEHITAAAQKLCAKHCVVFVPRVTRWDEREITINSKPWTDQRLWVTYRIYGPGGAEDFIEAETVGIGRDNSDKGANKAMSQAFKYVLLQTLNIADPKDDGDQQTHVTDERPARPAAAPELYHGWASKEDHDRWKARVQSEGKSYGDAWSGWAKAQGLAWPCPLARRGEVEAKLEELRAASVVQDAFPEAEVVS